MGLTQVILASTADTYVNRGTPDQNYGTGSVLAAASASALRSFIDFDPAAVVAAVGGGSVSQATLSVTLLSSGSGAAASHPIAVHAMTSGFSELGATWNCADDTDTSNAIRDCVFPIAWTLGLAGPSPNPWIPVATTTASIGSGQTGALSLDVTADVNALLAGTLTRASWVVLKASGSTMGFVTLGSRESASPPQLVLTLQGCPLGEHDGGDGTCVPLGTCVSGFGDCDGDGTCELSLSSVTDCGACGNACDDGNACTQDTCSAALSCVHSAVAGGSPCDDGDACTQVDTCQAGLCLGGSPASCAAQDACHVAGVCDPATGLCSAPAAPDGTACDDGNACTQGDTCAAGVCASGAPIQCAAQDPCQAGGSCDPATGLCNGAALPNGTACDDGNLCTQPGTCSGGVCAGQTPTTCVAKDPCHLPGTCDPTSGLCSNPQTADGTSCNDGDTCTDPDSCQSGVCVGGMPPDAAICGQAPLGRPPTMSPPTAGCPSVGCCSAVPTNDSLVITRAAHPTVLSRFPLQDVMDQIIALSGVSNVTALTLFQRWWDTQNDGAGAVFPTNTHCDSTLTNGLPSVNGYPIECPRPEGTLATVTDPFTNDPTAPNPDYFVPVALFNRFDLAKSDGSSCGEYRIVYAKQSGIMIPSDRLFIIFEAELPNPNPGCGSNGCFAVAEKWAELSNIDPADPNAETLLGDELVEIYFAGLPGFRPVVHPQNYGMTGDSGLCGPGNGQIRTNQFMVGANTQLPWQLREFKLARTCAAGGYGLDFVPVSVKNNPWGGLFQQNAPSPSAAFQIDFLPEVANLAANQISDIHMSTKEIYNAGQSDASGTENDYTLQIGPKTAPFALSIAAELTNLFGTPTLTSRHIVDRATTQSCAGCHHLSNGQALGDGLIWPFSLGFSHVDEAGQLSPALTSEFLPHRAQVLTDYLACNPPAGGSGTLGGCVTH